MKLSDFKDDLPAWIYIGLLASSAGLLASLLR
jgi:hypothetical protein